MTEPLSAVEARKLVRHILTSGTYGFTRHAKERMAERRMSQVDCVNVLRGGLVNEALTSFENGTWRYSIQTTSMAVVVAFRTEEQLVVVTAMRLSLEGVMQCFSCGESMVAGHENMPYDIGLPYQITLNGVVVHRCSGCDEYEVEIPKVEVLHREVALSVAHRRGRLAAGEIRFLRKSLGWSGRDFAERLEVAPETVSRWEHGALKMGERSELVLRMFVELGDRKENYVLTDEQPPPTEITATPDATIGWSVAA